VKKPVKSYHRQIVWRQRLISLNM